MITLLEDKATNKCKASVNLMIVFSILSAEGITIAI
jgi:hypothetical protein